jgi:hypothetical protein
LPTMPAPMTTARTDAGRAFAELCKSVEALCFAAAAPKLSSTEVTSRSLAARARTASS